MLTEPLFIAGDWGTSNLRLFLIGGGQVLARAEGPGVAAAAGRLEDVFFDAVDPWIARHGPLPVILCGMVGSTIGWMEAPYLDCPATTGDLAHGLLRFTARGLAIAIVPGLATTGPLGGPDVMRGEETQILGALATLPDLAGGQHLLCLPGTHSKWVLLRDGRVETFMTAMAGELFAVLRQHSVLGRGTGTATPGPGPAFTQGLHRAASAPACLPQLLFETRSRQLRAGLAPEEAAGFLSGLVIGADVAGALAALGDRAPATAPVTLIAAPALASLYEEALGHQGRMARRLDGDGQSLAGLSSLFAHADPHEPTNLGGMPT